MTACLRVGEPTPSDALVTWAAYPETVRTGGLFSLEFAGPVSPDGCGRLDTATVSVTPGEILLSARRSTFETLCAPQRVSYYEAHPTRIERAGAYRVRTATGLELGSLPVLDSAGVSSLWTIGRGTVRSVGGCWLFGPGWASNQRPFALLGAPDAVKAQAGKDRVVHVEGRLAGFSLCDRYGSRPSIRVDTAWVTDLTTGDYYP